MEIRYIKHEEIDIPKWDRCIHNSVNGTIYGYSWFLDIVSEDWDALVDDKYEAVMPLTNRVYSGIKVLVQPPFATNLGVYSVNVLDEAVVDSFIKKIPKRYKYINISFDKYNKISSGFFPIRHGCVYEIDLIRPYAKIAGHYNEKVKNALKAASENTITIVQGMNSADLIMLYLKGKRVFWKYFFRHRIKKIKMLIATVVKYKVGQIYGAYTRENTLCAAALFVWSHQKVFLLLFGFDKIGKKEQALEVLIDEFIKLHAEQNLTLRFEFTLQKKYSGLYSGFGGQRYEFLKIRRINFLS